MPTLPRLPLVAGVVLVGLLLGAVFLLSLPGSTLWQRVLQDAGHGPVFAGIAVVLLLMQWPAMGRPSRSAMQYLSVFVAATVIGMLTEVLQYPMPGRSVSAMDATHDAAGAALGLACAWLIERRLARKRSLPDGGDARTRFVVVLALFAFTLLAWQPLQCARAYADRDSTFPVLVPTSPLADGLLDRPRRADVRYEQLPLPYRHPDDANSVRLEFKPGSAPGLQLLEPYPDWRNRDTLVLDVTNPSSVAVHFMLRIFDATHDWTNADRFNQPVLIPGAARTTIRISLEAVATSPARRRMDMSAIANVMLFALQPLDTDAFYVTRVWLE